MGQVDDLQGVKLYTSSALVGGETQFSFEVENGNSFAVEVELNVEGVGSTSEGGLPFKHHVAPGEKKVLGWVSSPKDIEPTWSWQQQGSSKPITKATVFEAKGVFMTQTQTYNEVDPGTQLALSLRNSNAFKVDVEIDFTGDGHVDMLGRQRPILVSLLPHASLDVGHVSFTGDINVSWKWVEAD